MKQPTPHLSVAELEALMQGWGATPQQAPVDRFFPLRVIFLVAVSLAHAAWLLFDYANVASALTVDPQHLARLRTFLYFRGWLLITFVTIGLYAYLKAWYPAIVFSCLLLIGCVNLVSDIFIVYPERLARPTPQFTILLLLRLTSLGLLLMNIKNISRLPPPGSRLQLLLPFKR